MAYSPKNPNGQATMDNSAPVVLASNHSDVKVTLDSEAVVLGAGSAAIGKLAANSGVDIGDVDIASIAAGDNNIGNVDLASAIPAGTNNIGDVDVLTVNGVAPAFGSGARGATVQRVTIATDDSVPVTNAGITTIAGAVSGTEMQVDVLTMPTVTVTATNLDVQSGGADLATSAQGAAIQAAVETLDNAIAGSEMQVDVVGSLPAGTNAIGKLAANSGVDIGDVTLTAGTAAVGSILPPDTDVTAHTNYAKKYYTNAGAVTDGIIWSPAAGKRWHVHALYIQVSAAATVTLEDDKAGGDEAVWKSELAANSGAFLVFPEHYPLASGEDAADLIITTSAGNVYVTVVGYEI